MGSNVQLLIDKMLGLSNAPTIKEAVKEWITEFVRDKSTNCICGHRILKVFRAVNTVNNNVLDPIGSVCIKNFCEELQLCDTVFYKTYLDSLRVLCPDCGVSLINQTAFNMHVNSRKHKNNIGSWPCEDCGVRISCDNAKWMTRCLKCYKKSRGRR